MSRCTTPPVPDQQLPEGRHRAGFDLNVVLVQRWQAGDDAVRFYADTDDALDEANDLSRIVGPLVGIDDGLAGLVLSDRVPLHNPTCRKRSSHTPPGGFSRA